MAKSSKSIKDFKIVEPEARHINFLIKQAVTHCLRLHNIDTSEFIIVENNREPVGFIRIIDTGVYVELEGPFVDIEDESLSKKLKVKLVKEAIRRSNRYEIYLFTDLPETFEKNGFEIVYNGPSDLVLRTVPA